MGARLYGFAEKWCSMVDADDFDVLAPVFDDLFYRNRS